MPSPNAVLIPGATEAAIAGCNRLVSLINPKGKFVYAYDYKTGERFKKYNMVRHYGTLWAILTTLEKFRPQFRVGHLSSVLQSFAWAHKHVALQHSLPPDNVPPNIWQFVVWKDTIKLGANALALLAMSELIRHFIRNEFLYDSGFKLDNYGLWVNHAEQMAVGIHQLRKPDGSFVHKAIKSTMKETDFISEYYVGEALFALGHWRITCQMLNSFKRIDGTTFGSYKAFPLIWQSLQKLAQENYGVEFQSHWMLYAVSQEICHGSFIDELLPYMNNLVTDILAKPNYRRRKQSTPIACRSEGLLAALQAYDILQNRHNQDHQEILDKIIQALDVNILLQLQWAKKDGAVIQGDKSNLVQIDFLQHNVSAFANYSTMERENYEQAAD